MTTDPLSQTRVYAQPGRLVEEAASQAGHCPACAFVLFGATGDLSSRKVVPALLDLFRSGELPEGFFLVGVSRSAGDDQALRARLGKDIAAKAKDFDPQLWARFAELIFAVPGGAGDEQTYQDLTQRLDQLDRSRDSNGNRLFYLATPPTAFPPILKGLSSSGLVRRATESNSESWARVVVEKPFGHDLASARELNALCHRLFDESQLFRIDHYLGKETVQNILVLRFGNAIFEPLWNRNHISHVEITVAEDLDVQGRGAFYEETGVVRDVLQNHLLQMLTLCAMEAPISFGADEIRNMKSQVLRGLRPLIEGDPEGLLVPGQYEGYRSTDGVDSDSRTATYVAMVAHLDTWRWQGVPFYLRAGKGLATKRTEIAVHFSAIPFCLFGEERVCQLIEPNVLRMRIQPSEGVSLRVASKVPGTTQSVGGVDLDFSYAEAFGTQAHDAYQRLLLDAFRGDATLFARADEVELSWEYLDPVLRQLEAPDARPPYSYALGSEGPEAAHSLPSENGHRWSKLSS